jgi:probable HAF family extracellular repeat protein
MNSDGTNQTQLPISAPFDSPVAWAPDGHHVIATTDDAAGNDLFLISVDGPLTATQLTSAPANFFPSFSPDGHSISFASTRSGSTQIWEMNADGSGQTQITHDSTNDAEPAWGASPQAAPTPGPYTLIDLGFGGPGDINNNGSTTDIGTLGGRSTVPVSINTTAQIAGAAKDATGAWREFLWTNGTMQDLGPGVGPPGTPYYDSYPAPNPALKIINDRGQVAWTGPVATGGTHAFTWNGYVVQDLGALPGGSSSAAVINASGQVAGVSTDSAGVSHVVGWDKGTLYDLGTCPDSARVTIAGLNNKSQVLMSCLFVSSSGSYDSLNVDGYGYGQLWPLGTPPGMPDAQPGGLSDAITFFVNGFNDWGSPQYGQIFTWSNSSWTQVTNWGVHAVAMNAPGAIAGQVLSVVPHAALWDHGTTSILGDLTLYSSHNWSVATTLSDSADVLGSSDNHVVLWKRGAVVAAAQQRTRGTISAAMVRVVKAPTIGPNLVSRSQGQGPPPKWQVLMVGAKAKAKKTQP